MRSLTQLNGGFLFLVLLSLVWLQLGAAAAFGHFEFVMTWREEDSNQTQVGQRERRIVFTHGDSLCRQLAAERLEPFVNTAPAIKRCAARVASKIQQRVIPGVKGSDPEAAGPAGVGSLEWLDSTCRVNDSARLPGALVAASVHAASQGNVRPSHSHAHVVCVHIFRRLGGADGEPRWSRPSLDFPVRLVPQRSGVSP